jgi:glycine amidinotransferase/scyllo-inosamine-4-phosphate amidinotransferase 1
MRDLHLIVGNTVIESPSPTKYRFFEATGLYDIWYEYLKEGFRWICGPKPRLVGKYEIPFYENEQRLIKLSEDEILFDAANTVRMGTDLLYLVSASGNYLGAKWLQSMLGDEYKVHTTDQIYRSAHIDSTVLCLRPGLVLLNGYRVNEKNCPEIFNKWEKIYFSEIVTYPQETIDFQENVRRKVAEKLAKLDIKTGLKSMSSEWIGLNFLSLDPHTVVVDKRQIHLIKVLEKHNLTVIPINYRYSYFMGGIHCNTLDTVRESKLESYFE